MNLSELLTWPYVLATRRANAGLSALEAEEEERALSHLRSVFGEDVLAIPRMAQDRVLNWAPWTRRWLVWLSTSIWRVEQMPNYDKLRERLVDLDQIRRGVLRIASCRALGRRRPASEFRCPCGCRRRSEDAGHFGGGFGVRHQVSLEVSVMYGAKTQVDQSRIVEQIFRLLVFHDHQPLAFAGHLLRLVTDAEIEGLLGRIYWEMMEVRKEAAFREVVVDNALILALAPTEHTNDVASWALGHGLDMGSFTGTLPDLDGALGLQLKVDQKAR
jgi:hypothetical protein